MFSYIARKATDSSEEEEEEAVIGPVPAKGPTESNIKTEIEQRARRMKEKLLGQDDVSISHYYVNI